MQIAITSAGLAIVFFLCLYLGFRTGLRLGMQAVKGQMPPKIDPLKTAKEAVAPPKPDEFTANLLADHARMMDYDGFLPEEKR
jgi:hypothetical protein